VGRERQDLTPERRRPGPVITAGDFKRAFERFSKDEMGQRAAALTYFALLSLFPALLVGVSVLGLFGQESLVNEAANYLKDAGAPPEVVDAVTAALASAVRQRSTAGGALVIGLATALYGASGAFNSVGSALNQVFRVEEGRGFVKRKAVNLMWTTLLIALGLVTLVLLFLGGDLAHDVLNGIGLGDNLASVWNVVRWPLALLGAMLMYAIVFYAAPNVEIRHWRYITPGAIFGVGATLLASAGFFFYVSSFSSYSATYGAFAGVVILLIWLNLSSTVLLLGAELNAIVDLRRFRQLPDDYDGPVLPPKEPAET
jgi:membrane protein